MRTLRLLAAAIVAAFATCVRAQESEQFPAADSSGVRVEISLLTCSPGAEVYELYGHTALLVDTVDAGRATVYNYGVFDFETPHFVWRFVLGQTDYLLAPQPLGRFLYAYAVRGSSVVRQTINATPAEARAIAAALQEEARPENRVYRYDIFSNNCTTRARDMLESHLAGVVVYPARPPRYTLRSLLRRYTGAGTWATEGNDLLLGVEADTLLSERGEMFAPMMMMAYADSAMIDRGRGRFVPLVVRRDTMLRADAALHESDVAAQPSFPLPPAAVGWGALLIGLLIAMAEWRRRSCFAAVDGLLLTAQGLAGCIVCVLLLFSEHPTVGSNWQAWLLNPLPLLFVVPVVAGDIRRREHVYHYVAAPLTALFVAAMTVMPQHFATLTLPLALLLLSRAVVHLLVYRAWHRAQI